MSFQKLMFSSALSSVLTSSFILTSSVHAAEGAELDLSMNLIPVIGERADRSVIPGSATHLDAEDLETFKYQDVLRTLRFVPGVNIQEEDGYGLRPNIGFRGTGVERSSKITLMEDGVLIAPAPYAAPSAYYFPVTGRMEAVEVRKGSSAVKFGPRSVGGALNLISRSAPVSGTEGFVDARIGSDNLYTLHTAVGAAGDNASVIVEVFRSNNDGFKDLPNGDDTGFDIEDYLVKFKVNTDSDADIYQSLEIKLSQTFSDSFETYLGLSEADFMADANQRYAASALDHMDSEHNQVTLTHTLKSGDFEMVTTAYRNRFKRDWFKLDDMYVDGVKLKPAAVLADTASYERAYGILNGSIDSGEDYVRLKHNNRRYGAKGIQTNATFPLTLGGEEHQIEVLARYHEDFEDRVQFRESFAMVGGDLDLIGKGLPGSAGNRLVSSKAFALAVQDTITLGDLTLVPGVRFENIDLDRSDWAGDDPARTGVESQKEITIVKAVVPGIGASYTLNETITLTGGLFEGFNPPGPGSVGAEEEKSLNVEAGFIYDNAGYYVELVGFYSDYDNILGTCTNATGCATGDVGDQFNGGAAKIKGLEFVAGYTADLNANWSMPMNVTYTYTDAAFSTSFEDGFWGDVMDGDKMPYVARHQLTVFAGLEREDLALNMTANYLSATRSEAGQGAIPADEKIDGRLVFDLSAHYTLFDGYKLFASVENLFDETYVVARRPIGLRPGMARTLTAGFKIEF